MARAFALVLIVAALAPGCSGGNETVPRTSTQTPTPSESVASGVASCWRDVAGRYELASDAAIPILRDGVARLLDRYDSLGHAEARGDARAVEEAVRAFIDALGRVTDESSRFEELRRQAATAEEACSNAAVGSQAVSCWNDVAQAYETSSGQAADVLDTRMAAVFFGLQSLISAGKQGNADALRQANRTLGSALEDVLPPAARFARLAGAAKRKAEGCSA